MNEPIVSERDTKLHAALRDAAFAYCLGHLKHRGH